MRVGRGGLYPLHVTGVEKPFKAGSVAGGVLQSLFLHNLASTFGFHSELFKLTFPSLKRNFHLSNSDFSFFNGPFWSSQAQLSWMHSGCLRNFISVCFSSEKKITAWWCMCWVSKSKWTSRDRHYTCKIFLQCYNSQFKVVTSFWNNQSFKSDWDEAGFLSSKVHSQKENTDVLRGPRRKQSLITISLLFPKSTFQTSFVNAFFPSVWDSRANDMCSE